MISIRCLRIASVAIAITISANSAGAWHRVRVKKARVQFLATSTLIRNTWGWNEDAYLAEIHSTNGSVVIVRLLDRYLNLAPPLSFEVLTASTGAVLPLKRDSRCDLPYSQMVLRTAPGDAMAIARERLGYQPRLDTAPEAGAVLLCFQVVRR